MAVNANILPTSLVSTNVDVSKAKVLVVDDNEDLLKLISIRLRPLKLELKTATSAEEALSLISQWPPNLVITDLQMSGMTGMELFEQLRETNPFLPVIILTAHGTIPDAVEATQAGVASYLTKPFDSEALITHIEVALQNSGFTSEHQSTSNGAEPQDSWRKNIISKSPAMDNLLNQIEQLSNSNCAIAFEGEPGTGKEELARAAHACSARANKPLEQISCTSLPENLLEAEIFGRDASGAGGAVKRLGLLREAAGSSLLLVDYNEVSIKFLRRIMLSVINGFATPVDSDKSYPVDVRLLGTTTAQDAYGQNNSEIWELGNRLELTILSVPALRDRLEDIPLIANHCLNTEFAELGLQFSNRSMQILLATQWSGNVRHLINSVRQCARLTKSKIISDSLVSSRIKSPIYRIQPLTNAHRNFEREYLTDLLKVTNGNVTQAASLAKRNRTEIHRLLKKHKIEAKSFRT